MNYIKLISSVIGFLCCVVHGVAQETKVDSLFAIWKDVEQSDSIRVAAMSESIRDIISFDIDSAWALTHELIIFGQEKKYPKAQADALHLQGLIHYKKKEFEKELECYEKSLAIRKGLPNRADISASYYHIGLVYRGLNKHEIALEYLEKALAIDRDIGNNKQLALDLTKMGSSSRLLGRFKEALEYFNQALEVNSNLGENEDVAWSLFEIGSVYIEQGRYKDALKYFNQCLPIFEGLEHKKGIARIYTQMGRIYNNQNLPQKGLEYHKKSLKTSEELNDQHGVHNGFNNLGMTHRRLGDNDKALDFFQRSLEVCEEIVCDRGKGYAFNNIGNTYRSLGQFDLALDYLQRALEVRERIGNKRGICSTLNNIGSTYFLKGNYPLAIAYSERALPLAMEMESWYHQSFIYEALYETNKASGNMTAALDYHEKYIAIRDSMRNKDMVVELKTLEFDQIAFQDSLINEQKKLEAELTFRAELNQQKINRNIFIALGVAAILFAIALLSRLRYIRRTQKILEGKNKIIEAEKEKAKASERAKHQFLANMSHEIRTPMNAIKGMTDILIRRDPRPEQNDFLKGIKQSSDSLLVIINDILDISKIEAGKIELEKIPFQVSEVLDGVQTIMQFKAEEKGLDLQKITAEALPELEGDPTRLRQILINLVSNAIKFTEKGVVSIRTKVLQQSEQQVELQFTVSDTGVGIGADRLDKIFETFEQAYSDTTRKFGGTGLGLSISKKLVELQGGSIWVESEKGKGSQFHFTIPFTITLQNTEQLIAATDSRLALSLQLKGINILLVEDNTFNVIVAQEELEDAIENVVVDLAENGAIAVEKVQSGCYDIILMDVQMPVMNGYEATQKIRSLMNGKSSTPIIAMTANVMKEEVERCYEAGMDDFIGKPFDTDELLNKIYQLKTSKRLE